jgi:hypothetical protein
MDRITNFDRESHAPSLAAARGCLFHSLRSLRPAQAKPWPILKDWKQTTTHIPGD